MSPPLVATSSPSTSARPSVAGDRPSRILIMVDWPPPLAPTSPVTPAPTSTESRSSAVTRGNRLLRLSVAITVTSSTVVTPATPVVTPQSCLRINLESYGALGVPPEVEQRRAGCPHPSCCPQPEAGLLTQPPTTVTFAGVRLRARTAIGVRPTGTGGGGMTTAVTEELAAESLGFRRLQRLQRLGYECAEALAHGLRPGATEREAARTQRPWLRERGVRDRFHQPFAWFGDGT